MSPEHTIPSHWFKIRLKDPAAYRNLVLHKRNI